MENFMIVMVFVLGLITLAVFATAAVALWVFNNFFKPNPMDYSNEHQEVHP